MPFKPLFKELFETEDNLMAFENAVRDATKQIKPQPKTIFFVLIPVLSELIERLRWKISKVSPISKIVMEPLRAHSGTVVEGFKRSAFLEGNL